MNASKLCDNNGESRKNEEKAEEKRVKNSGKLILQYYANIRCQ